jgi:hypothetical protein
MLKSRKKAKLWITLKKTGFFSLFLCRLGVGRGKVSSMPIKSLCELVARKVSSTLKKSLYEPLNVVLERFF